jgi:hypothetical protein
MTTTPSTSTDNGNQRPHGGQPGNRNAQRHGLRSSNLPAGCKAVENRLHQFGKAMRTAIVDARGGMSIVDAALVQSAIRHEKRAALAERWLRVEPELTLEQRLTLMRESSAATDSRDKCLEKLKLDRADTSSILSQLYQQPPRIAEPATPVVASCDPTPNTTAEPSTGTDAPGSQCEAVPETVVPETGGAD